MAQAPEIPLSIQIDPEQIQGLVEAAIMQQLSQEQRDMLIQQALTALMTPRKSTTGWHSAPVTPLREAFDQAVRSVAHKAAAEALEGEAGEQVVRAVGVSIAEVCKNEYDGLAEAVGQAVGQAVTEYLRKRTQY